MKININLIYPIGSIYITTKNISPENLFGGTWQKFSKGRCLIGEGVIEDNTDNSFGQIKSGDWTAYAGNNGGEISHILTINEMPSHRHNLNYGSSAGGDRTGYVYSSASGSGPAAMHPTGGSTAHNNLPPYVVVYMWERIG